MIEEAPDPKEVSTFHFCQLRSLKLAKANESMPSKALNVIAAASKYGLLFVGIENGFKILKLENILDLDEDKENKSIEENYYSQIVPSQTPVLLSLSADHKTLAVCISNNSYPVANMYDIAVFADPEEIPVPFLNVQLAVNPIELKEFIWNPVIDGMYSYCLSDGSLHVHELAGTVLKIIANLPSATATAACWSPKGKQLVVGKSDGSFAQFKPTLQEVKSVSPPKTDDGTMSVTSISWISTTLFAVLYVPEGLNVSPNLFMVSTPKGSAVVYTNFYDVCLGNASSKDQRYFLHYESAWGILVCASTDSIEIAVIGDPPNWVQWDIREDGKALLPGKDGATHAVGMSIMYCAQRRIIISEQETYPPMPVIFFLTNNGLLVPFHMINSAPDSVSLVRPSTPIERDGERKRSDVNENSTDQCTSFITSESSHEPLNLMKMSSAPVTSVAPASAPQLQMDNKVSQGFGFPGPGSLSFGFSAENTTAVPSLATFMTKKVELPNLANEFQPQTPGGLSSFQSVFNPKAVSAANSFFGTSTPQINSTVLPEVEKVHKVSKGMSFNVSVPVTSKENAGSTRPLAVAQRTILMNKTTSDKDMQSMNSTPKVNQPSVQISAPQNLSNEICQRDSIPLSKHHTYLSAVIEEIHNFDKELQDLKLLSNNVTSIGTKEEMSLLKSNTLDLQEFQNDMSETMLSLNSDIHSLKNALVESFVMVEEANSRERRKNDHSYISMLKDRALDPMTAKRMQKINQHYQYLSTQLQEVSDKLDQDWIEFLELKRKNNKAVHHISSTEAIYKTIVNNQKIIHNLRKNVDSLSKKISQKRIENVSKNRNWTKSNKRSNQEELSKLADAFLKAQISSTEDEEPILTRKISSEAQTILKQFLSNSTVSTVRPTVTYSPSQSRLISKSLLYNEQSATQKNQINSETNNSNNVHLELDELSLESMPVNWKLYLGRTSQFSDEDFNSISDKDVVALESTTDTFHQVNMKNGSGGLNDIKSANYADDHKDNLSKHDTASSPISGGAIYEEITPPDSPSDIEGGGDVLFSKEGHQLFQSELSSLPLERQTTIPTDFLVKDSANQSQPTTNVSVSQVQNSSLHLFESKSFPSSLTTSNMKPSFVSLSSASKTLFPEYVKNTENSKIQSEPVFSKFTCTVPSSFLTVSTVTSSKTEIQSEFPGTPVIKSDSLKPQYTFSNNTTVATSSVNFLPAVSSHQSSQSNLMQNNMEKVHFGQKSSVLPSFIVSGQSKEALPGQSGGISVGISKSENTAAQVTSSLESFVVPASSKPSPPLVPPNNSAKTSVFGHGIVYSKESLVLQQASPLAHSSDQSGTKSEHSETPKLSKAPQLKTAAASEASEVPISINDTKTTKNNVTKTVAQSPIILSTFEEKSDNENNLANAQFAVNQVPVTMIPHTKSDKIITSDSTISPAATSSLEKVIASSAPPIFNPLASMITTTISAVASTSQAISTSSIFNKTSSASQNQTIFPPTSTTVIADSTAASIIQPNFNQTLSTATVPVTLLQETSGSDSLVITVVTTSTASPSLFGQTATVASVFNQTTNTTSFTSAPSTTTSVFGQKSGQTSTFFNQASTTQSSFFSKPPSDAPVFGQVAVTQSSPFGQTSTNTSGPFTQAASSFFTQPPGGQTSVFGGNTTNNNSGFSNQAATSGFSFSKSSFGQSTGTFGLAKAVFGQNTSTFQQPPSSTSSSFDQASGSVFGQGSFFSGLGGKPNAETASKNVFGAGNLGKPNTESNIFGNTGGSTFGSKTGGSFSGGSFSSGTGSVAQSGFGAFQQTPQKTGGFGSPPAFGSAPAFGSTPSFGSPPAFSNTSAIGGSVFGGQQSGNFSNFASASSPTFGSLASQSPSFGNSPQPGFGQQQTTPFGAAPVFGSSPSFGGQSSSFGSPNSGQSNTSAFTQWRNN